MAIRKIIQRSTDNLFVNTEIEGTEAAKMPVGTTAQRANAKAGDQRFNSTISLMEYYDGTNWKAIDTPPTITSISPTAIADSSTSFDIVITGQNFSTGATVKAIGTDGSEINATTVVVDSTSQVTATFNGTSFSDSLEDYDIKLTALSGLSATLDDSLTVNASPTWTTAAGNLGTVYDDASVNLTVAATDPEGGSITYSVSSGYSLHGGLSLNSSTGAITGDPTDVGGDTTNIFSLDASDGTNTVPRTFNIIIRQALGTLTNPATSAKQLYDAGKTTDGTYYINNIWTNGSTDLVYCKMGLDFGGQGTLYHVQKAILSDLSGFSQYGNFTPSSATLSTISTQAEDFGTYNYRYTTSSSGSGAAGVRQTGLRVNQLDSSGFFVIVDHKANSYGDGGNPIGDGGPAFDTNTTGDVASNQGSHTYSNEWQNGYSTSDVSSGGPYYAYGFLYGSGLSSGGYSADSVTWYAGRGSSQTNAWNSLFSSSKDTFTRSSGAYTINSTDYIAFKHQGWSDVGNSAQSDMNYWVAAEI